MKTTLYEADPKGPLARGGHPYHLGRPPRGKTPDLRFEPSPGLISLSYKLLFLLLF